MATVTSTAAVTVNAAFLQEIKDVNQDLWQLLIELRSLCADPYQIRARRNQFVGMLEDLRDHLALHFALEEAYGYFDDPVEVAPRLCERAAALRFEHQDLYVLACQLVESAESMLDKERASRAVLALVGEFQAFDRRLKHHESQENELILQEYDDDIGVGD